jgi:hypothetical protein
MMGKEIGHPGRQRKSQNRFAEIRVSHPPDVPAIPFDKSRMAAKYATQSVWHPVVFEVPARLTGEEVLGLF